jgi:uncharacterized protein with HEPN domain
MSKRENILLLEDMLEAASKIKRYTSGLSYDQFTEDEKTIDAVIRNFEIIGEAANRIDPDFRLENSQIEWSRIRGFRNRIVHDYFGIDHDIVWTIIEEYLDDLIDWLETLLDNNKS